MLCTMRVLRLRCYASKNITKLQLMHANGLWNGSIQCLVFLIIENNSQYKTIYSIKKTG